MPNFRQVAAISYLIRRWRRGDQQMELAEWLVRRGVIVPRELTDDEAVKIGADAAGFPPTDRAEIAHCVREGLERIAKRGAP